MVGLELGWNRSGVGLGRGGVGAWSGWRMGRCVVEVGRGHAGAWHGLISPRVHVCLCFFLLSFRTWMEAGLLLVCMEAFLCRVALVSALHPFHRY